MIIKIQGKIKCGKTVMVNTLYKFLKDQGLGVTIVGRATDQGLKKLEEMYDIVLQEVD